MGKTVIIKKCAICGKLVDFEKGEEVKIECTRSKDAVKLFVCNACLNAEDVVVVEGEIPPSKSDIFLSEKALRNIIDTYLILKLIDTNLPATAKSNIKQIKQHAKLVIVYIDKKFEF